MKELPMARPHIVNFGTLPRDPDRDAPLVDLRELKRSREEIVLAPELARKLDRIEAEYRAMDLLAKDGLSPKTRLLFIGPPGCGKTLCAEVLAADLGLPLLYARFDGIVSSFLGETANNLRRLFGFARNHASILFFDEFDALAKRRDDPHEVGELKRVVGSFLQILDSYPRDRIVVAATNHQGLLDEALWRRFDEVLAFGKPKHEEIIDLMQRRLRGVRKAEIDFSPLAREMDGFTYADAERVCFEAIKSMRLGEEKQLRPELLVREIGEQRDRIALSTQGPAS